MIINRLTLKAGGPAGSGVFTIGAMVARSLQRLGLHIFYSADYPSLIKGGHNTCHIRAEAEEVHSQNKEVDILIAIDKETIELHFNELSEGGAIIYDSTLIKTDSIDMSSRKDILMIPIPMTDMGKELGNKIYMNIVAVGAISALIGHDLEKVDEVLVKQFTKKGPEVVEANKQAAKKGHEYFKENFKDIKFKIKVEKIDRDPTIIISGNEALSIGAVKAGCKFYAAYPMTPASGILHFMASIEKDYGVVVKQTESELAAINMTCGAAMTGVRAMTGTSGGGFALMTEAFGMAGMSESPLVLVESQRAGSSTGLPTYTEQGDLRFCMHASQGEFPRLLMAPGDVDEAFYETFKMFNLVEKVQTPGIILMDKHISASSKTTKPYDVSGLKIDRGCLMSDKDMESRKDNLKRYELTESGISPRPVPGQPNGLYVNTSYEHDETGWTSEDPVMTISQVDKRARKLLNIKPEEIAPRIYGDEDAELTLVSWGSNKGMILEAMKMLKAEGIKVKFMHILWILPFPAQAVLDTLMASKKVLMIEQNKSGQMKGIIREHTGYEIKDFLSKYDGRPIDPEEIYAKVKEVLSR